MALNLRGSVGKGGDNLSADVRSVKTRLSELGFEFFSRNGKLDPDLILAIRLFQSVIAGRNTIGGDGRIDVGGKTNRYLDADIAPCWQLMPVSGPGFDNFEARDVADQHDFGTSWLAETLLAAAADYNQDYLASHPDAPPLTINDVSLPWGGDTPDHVGHETGMACDLRLPRLDGGTGGIGNPNTNSHYDREAMRAQLRALHAQPLFQRAFFNDRELIADGLCQHLARHNNHVHIDIQAPPNLPAAATAE